jgi:DNA-binding NarL/FixJ family response regulator
MRRALLVGSEDFLITAMRFAVRQAPGVQALGVLEREGGLAEAISEARPDLVLLEASTDAQRTLARLSEVREECPGALVMVVATTLDVELFQEVARQGMIACLGALPGDRAVAVTDAEPYTRGIPHLEVVEPECTLTPRELEVLRSVAEGKTNAQIGRDLWLTEQTVKFHLSKVYRKLGVSNRTAASRYAFLRGLHAPQHATRRRLVVGRERLIGRVESQSEHVNGHRALSGAAR